MRRTMKKPVKLACAIVSSIMLSGCSSNETAGDFFRLDNTVISFEEHVNRRLKLKSAQPLTESMKAEMKKVVPSNEDRFVLVSRMLSNGDSKSFTVVKPGLKKLSGEVRILIEKSQSKAIDVIVQADLTGSLFLYRIVLEPHNLDAKELQTLPKYINLSSNVGSSFVASLPTDRSLKDGRLVTDWTYCSTCFKGKPSGLHHLTFLSSGSRPFSTGSAARAERDLQVSKNREQREEKIRKEKEYKAKTAAAKERAEAKERTEAKEPDNNREQAKNSVVACIAGKKVSTNTKDMITDVQYFIRSIPKKTIFHINREAIIAFTEVYRKGRTDSHLFQHYCKNTRLERSGIYVVIKAETKHEDGKTFNRYGFGYGKTQDAAEENAVEHIEQRFGVGIPNYSWDRSNGYKVVETNSFTRDMSSRPSSREENDSRSKYYSSLLKLIPPADMKSR